MFENVIVGVDGEDGGRDAIALAKILRAKGGELTLAHVDHASPHLWGGSHAVSQATDTEATAELLQRERERAGVDAQSRRQRASSVGRGLHELAEKGGADLLVIGSSRRGLLGRVLIGDDTRDALNGAPCAVAIAPSGYSSQPVVLREIGVGYDGSPESEHALGVARRLAEAHQTTLSAFEAVSLPSYAFTGAPVPLDQVIEDMVNGARERLTAVEHVEPHVAYGRPAEELALYSASLDLLVLGSRSYGPMGRLVYGSTALQLARSARCPLLVLTRAAREADGTQASQEESQAAGAVSGPDPAR